MSDGKNVKAEMAVNQDEIRQDETLVYTLNILNKTQIDIRNIIVTFIITEGLFFIGGMVKRQRGMMEIDKYIDLEVGNLVWGEEATIKIELEVDELLKKDRDTVPIDIKGYALITFECSEKIKKKVKSNIIYTKITDHNL